MGDMKKSENNGLIAGNTCEDEEMTMYKKSSINVITFHMVYHEVDLDIQGRKSNSFKPEMAHQVFGETEMIFGYRHLSINIFYLHNSAKCYVDVVTSGKIEENDLYKADNIMEALNPWLPENYSTSKETFLNLIKEEDHCKMFGNVIVTFHGEKNKVYKVTHCDTNDQEFRNFHQRFETLIVWFIDGANYIDLEDSRWMIFYVYEEQTDASDKITRSPVAFCTVYNFFLYPNSTRPRISQFFVLPTHQRRGIGTQLYRHIFEYLKSLPDSGDITVEEPTPTFQKIRDYCDSLSIYKDLKSSKIQISQQNYKQITEFLKKHKICKRQAQRVFDILESITSQKSGNIEYAKFKDGIKTRIANDIERETRGSKRLCNLERAGIVQDHIDKKAIINAEFHRYIDSLEWPVGRLVTELHTISTE